MKSSPSQLLGDGRKAMPPGHSLDTLVAQLVGEEGQAKFTMLEQHPKEDCLIRKGTGFLSLTNIGSGSCCLQ